MSTTNTAKDLMAAAEDAQSIQHITKKVPPKNYGQQITPELASFFGLIKSIFLALSGLKVFRVLSVNKQPCTVPAPVRPQTATENSISFVFILS